MPDYRRNHVPGGTYFFTVTLLDRSSGLLVSHIDALRDSVRRTRNRAPFHIDAWVVLPDHMHCVWTLPAGDDDYTGRWRALKKGFSKAISVGEYRSAVRVRRRERGIWQRRFWEHTIRDERDYAVHLDYVHFNPVKHGLVGRVGDWPYSSFHWCVRRGIYPAQWGAGGGA
jgi:putative transposase